MYFAVCNMYSFTKMQVGKYIRHAPCAKAISIKKTYTLSGFLEEMGNISLVFVCSFSSYDS